MEFADRYAHIAFLISLLPFTPFQLFTDSHGWLNAQRAGVALYGDEIAIELEKFQKSLDLQGIEVVYLYGLGLGWYYEPLKHWLKASPDRALVFLEDDPAVFALFDRAPLAKTLLSDQQVHLYFLADQKSWKKQLEEIVADFPTDRIVCASLSSYEEARGSLWKEMSLFLMRQSAAVDALFTDVLNAHHLFNNLFPNIVRLSSCFFVNRWQGRFEKMPAILCGAGPSLDSSCEILKQMGHQALIIAGGSAITALTTQGVRPHLALALDPNLTEFHRLKPSNAFELPFLFSPRLSAQVFDLCNGPFGYVKTDTGGAFESWMIEQLQLLEPAIGPEMGIEAFSVMTIATALAAYLGCDPIVFVGMDLCFSEGKRYAQGVVVEELGPGLEKKAIDQLMTQQDCFGKKVTTLTKWVMESEAIGSFTKRFSDRLFLNATGGGLGFPNVAEMPLEEIAHHYFKISYDFEGLIRSEIETTQLKINIDLRASLKPLRLSLMQLSAICEEMLREISRIEKQGSSHLETARMVLLEMDLHEEMAFQVLFQTLFPVLDQIAKRRIASAGKKELLHWKKTKWQQLSERVFSYLKTLEFYRI